MFSKYIPLFRKSSLKIRKKTLHVVWKLASLQVFLNDFDYSFDFDQLLREKCPNTEFFVVRIFPHSDWIFSPNAGKYRSEKTPYLDTFHAVAALKTVIKISQKYP